MNTYNTFGSDAIGDDERRELRAQMAKVQVAKCDSCGCDDEGLRLAEYEDEGDPSVGYGPITETLCDDCAKGKGLI